MAAPGQVSIWTLVRRCHRTARFLAVFDYAVVQEAPTVGEHDRALVLARDDWEGHAGRARVRARKANPRPTAVPAI
jgi:hypothetical protein